MKKATARKTKDNFIDPAQRAFRGVAKELRKGNFRLGLPLIDSRHHVAMTASNPYEGCQVWAGEGVEIWLSHKRC